MEENEERRVITITQPFSVGVKRALGKTGRGSLVVKGIYIYFGFLRESVEFMYVCMYECVLASLPYSFPFFCLLFPNP